MPTSTFIHTTLIQKQRPPSNVIFLNNEFSTGTDPATDLRGTGFLGLMHTLYFVMDPETLPLARDIYKLSQHPTQVSPAHKKPTCSLGMGRTRF